MVVALGACPALSQSKAAPVAANAPRYEIARYLNIRSSIQPTYSPTTDDVAYLTNITGTNQVWKNPVRGGYPEQLTFFDDRVQFLQWSPKGDVIVFGKDQGGDERSQLFVMDPNGETIDPLTTNAKVIHSLGDFSRDGARIC